MGRLSFVGALLLCCGFFVSTAGTQEAPPPQPKATPVKEVEWLHNELDAVGWAFTALVSYDEDVREWVRFVYVPPWADKGWVAVTDVAVNLACNHTTTLIRGDRHAGGWLLGYRLDLLAPDLTRRRELARIWDFAATRESRFHIPSTNVVEVVEGGQRVRRTKSTAILAPHLEKALAQRASGDGGVRVDVLVTQLSKSTGGVYPADFFVEQLLASKRGLYPEFRQMFGADRQFKKLSALLQERGFFLDQAISYKGDKGALLLVSDVTGKSRVILAVFGLAGGVPLAVTYDFKDAKIRPDQQFIRNVVDFRPQSDASELFVPLPNGLVEFVLADAKGNIQRAAPPDVVADFTKPDGYTKELEMGMSCIMCHFPENGYRTAKNDMELLLGSDADFIGDDFSHQGKKLTREEAVALVAGRFGERIDLPDGVLGRARRDFIKSIDVLTDHEVTADGPSSVQQVGESLRAIYHGYRYGKIDADRACLELGLRVPAGTGKQWLRTIAPAPVGTNEDIIIALLKNGAEIKRDDFEPVYVELARRVVAYREAQKRKGN